MVERKVSRFAMWTHETFGYSWKRQFRIEKAEKESKKALCTTCVIAGIGVVGSGSNLRVHAEDNAGSMISEEVLVEPEVEVEIITETEGDAIPEQIEGAEGTGEAEGTEGTGELEGTEGTGELEGTEGTGELEGAEGTGELEGTGEAEGTEGTGELEGTGEAEGTEGTGELEGTEGTGELEGAGESEGTEGTGELEGAGESEGAGEAEGAGESEGAEGAEGAEGTEGAGETVIFNDESDVGTAAAGYEEAEAYVAPIEGTWADDVYVDIPVSAVSGTNVGVEILEGVTKMQIVEKGVTINFYDVTEEFVLSHTVERGGITLTESEKELAARVVYPEANNQGLTGQVMVANNFFNRMRRGDGDLTAVVMAENQFASPASSYTEENMRAVEIALQYDYTLGVLQAIAEAEGLSEEYYAQGSLGFYNPYGCSELRLHERENIVLAVRYKGHIFYCKWDK